MAYSHNHHQATGQGGHGAPCCGQEGGGDVPALRDPVCGMAVTADSPHRHEHRGHSHYFFTARCRERFIADPDAYL